MTEVIADLLGDSRRSISVPFSDARLEALVASTVTGEDRELLEPLMAGLHGDLIVERNAIRDVFGVEPTPFTAAAREAISAMALTPS